MSKYLAKMPIQKSIQPSGVSSLGVPGVPWHTQMNPEIFIGKSRKPIGEAGCFCRNSDWNFEEFRCHLFQ
jgi:hypothetical protein